MLWYKDDPVFFHLSKNRDGENGVAPIKPVWNRTRCIKKANFIPAQMGAWIVIIFRQNMLNARYRTFTASHPDLNMTERGVP
jgi:hypothetical protein